jgi:hypothetical protein
MIQIRVECGIHFQEIDIRRRQIVFLEGTDRNVWLSREAGMLASLVLFCLLSCCSILYSLL